MRRVSGWLSEGFLIALGLGTAATVLIALWVLFDVAWWVPVAVLVAFGLLALVRGPDGRR